MNLSRREMLLTGAALPVARLWAVANRPVVPQPGTRPAQNAVPPLDPAPAPAPPASPRAGTPIINVGRVSLPTGESRIILTELQVNDQEIATFQREVAALTGIAFD